MASELQGFLGKAYALRSADETHALYAKWAVSYEDEIRANGYVTPNRCAQALSEVAGDKHAPLLDLGCGTGLSGEALKSQGFTTIDGSDFSQEMLDVAKSKTGVYRTLTLTDLAAPLPFSRAQYTNVAAVGVFSPGHAPAEMIARVVALLPSAGSFVFSLNDHALTDRRYVECIDELAGAQTVDIAFKEHGEHLPAQGIGAVVYVLRRT